MILANRERSDIVILTDFSRVLELTPLKWLGTGQNSCFSQVMELTPLKWLGTDRLHLLCAMSYAPVWESHRYIATQTL